MFALLIPFLLLADQSHTVTTRPLAFRAGVAAVSGRANYAHSYVYTFAAKKGQKLEIELQSKEPEMKFSLTCDQDIPPIANGFAVTKWNGAVPAACKYSVVGVMNNSDRKAVPYMIRVRMLQ